MAEHVPHEDDEIDWVVVAQADGILPARDHISITQAATALRSRARALGVPIDQVAKERYRAYDPDRATMTADEVLDPVAQAALVEGLDLHEEIALHQEIRRRRGVVPDLDAATKALLWDRLGPDRSPQPSSPRGSRRGRTGGVTAPPRR